MFNAVSKDLKVSATKVQNIAKGNNLTLNETEVVFRIPEFRQEFFRLMKNKGWNAANIKYLMDKERMKLVMRERVGRIIPNSLKKILMEMGIYYIFGGVTNRCLMLLA